jgi:hypothetical protein
MREAGHVACTKETNSYKPLFGKPQGKRTLERSKDWKCANVKIDLRETNCEEAVNWIELVQNLAGSREPYISTGNFCCEHGNEPLGSIKKAGYSLTN